VPRNPWVGRETIGFSRVCANKLIHFTIVEMLWEACFSTSWREAVNFTSLNQVLDLPAQLSLPAYPNESLFFRNGR
jgi:hypothetical protein